MGRRKKVGCPSPGVSVKAFLFVIQLVLPTGPLPPETEPMPSLEACMERVAQKKFGDINDDFRFAAGCIQLSKKADPA